MVSKSELTAKAQIRDCALTLFAERGPESVTVRDIAACAKVSAGLVLHHYGSKQGLRDAVDEHVASVFDVLLDGVADLSGAATGGEAGAGGVAEMLLSRIPPGSPIPAYLRRLLLSGDEAGRRLFRQWFAMSRAVVQQLESSGAMHTSADADMRAAFLLVNDLAMIVLHDNVAEVIGTDPLSPEGLGRWAADAMDAYTRGVFAPPAREEQQ